MSSQGAQTEGACSRLEGSGILGVYAWTVVLATWVLIWIGGLVTSKGVGMSVPDWPTSYGYNMFFFPWEQWKVGGIFHEHLHRLVASGVGLLTLVLACWVQWREPRRWVRRLAWAALALVLVQGLLGGLRVRLNDHLVFTTTLGTVFGVTHATLAQLFLSSLIGLAWAMSSAWRGKGMRPESSPGLRLGVWMVTGLIFVQLLVAATMRHQHAGLAVPDFPLAHGHWYPPTDPAFLEMLNARRMDYLFDERITAFHIHVHMVHRFLALVILAGVLWMALRLRRVGGQAKTLGAFWGGIIFVQFGLGIATVLSHKAADLATAHVAVGALSLVSGVTTGLLLCRWAWQRRHSVEGGLDAAPVKVGRVGNLDWAGTAPTSVKAG